MNEWDSDPSKSVVDGLNGNCLLKESNRKDSDHSCKAEDRKVKSKPTFPLVHWLCQISPYYIEIRRSL
jgi:hypothetical protein